MSRWGRGRSGSVAVPLDSALFRENTNCPSAARSAGTVGKWGITSFTSIRSAPYAYSNNVVKKPVRDQNRPLTVPAVETDQPPPKPKKFFKSRNTEAFTPVPQITYAPPVQPAGLSPEHPSSSKEKKTNKRSRVYNRGGSSSPELPRRISEKTKARKNSVATKASKKEDSFSEGSQPPNKRYLVRTRNKVINYAEDGSNSPIPDFSDMYEELPTEEKIPTPTREPTPPRVALPEVSPSVASPTKTDVASPSTSKDSSDERKPPPIVLRISKGTSRIVSTDSNEGFTSPSSDRHSSLDVHSDFSQDVKKSPTLESICSPKHEGLKITIKCGALKQEAELKESKKEKKKHRKHHKHNEETAKRVLSPAPGTDNYDLYKTLASPAKEKAKDSESVDEIESQLAKLDSTVQPTKSPRINSRNTEPLPEPKPPESSRGRSRRNRPNINYNENDDFFDTITSSYSPKQQPIKTVSDLKRETRKTRRKAETPPEVHPVSSPEHQPVEPTIESQVHKNDLIDILSAANDKNGSDTHKKPHKKQRHKHYHSKHSSPEHVEPIIPSQNTEETTMEETPIEETPMEETPMEETPLEDTPMEETPIEKPDENIASFQETTIDSDGMINNKDNPNAAGSNQPLESVHNGATENSEEEDNRKSVDDAFTFPNDEGSEEHIGDKPSVKLVITKKKGSIFKSKSLVNDESPLPARKRRHLYKHEWANDKGNETPRPEQTEETPASAPAGDVPQVLTKVTRYRDPDPIRDDLMSTETVQPYTSVRCAKEAKEYYTVVRNVKKAHQIQEIGEFQEFNDDVEYLLDALQDNNPISTRCLSAITLASKCTAPAFRMHLRAHGTVQKFFSALHDATVDQSLGLCTATVMFVLSQDRLNMDLDRESLELMLNLLESDASHKNALDDCGLTSAQLTKTQERVRELCAEIKSQGKAKHLDLDNITVGHLAMETLLSLTSKRAGEWFKEELRVLGGVEHIVRTIQDCASQLHVPASAWDSARVDVLRKADRCMRVLENVTQQNEDNQMYLLSSVNGASQTVASLLIRCASEAKVNMDIREPLLDAALPALKVLVNLSHSFGDAVSLGAQIVGALPGVMEICLMLLNNQGNFIPDSKSFEFNICLLLLLINLVQNNEVNSQRLLNIRVRIDNEDVISRSVPALDLIIDLFHKREELARRAEENTDALLDGKKDDQSDNKKHSQDDIDETVTKLLAKAGAHMEHTMVGAYMALLVGHAGVASGTVLPDYRPLLPTLRKYYTFLSLTASAEAAIVAHVKATHKIIQFMEAHDKQESEESQSPSQGPSPTAPTVLHTPHVQHTHIQSPAAYSMNNYPGNYYQTSPSDVPQDMSLSNLNCGLNYSSSSSDRMSNSIDGYH